MFVCDAPEKAPLVSAPLLLSELDAWVSRCIPGTAEKRDVRLTQIKQAIAAGQWERWSRGAYDALLQPANKVKTQ